MVDAKLTRGRGAVERVALGEDGGVPGAGRGSMIVDMTTSSPLATRRFAAALDASGMEMVDAPVSGGPTEARLGTLSIMAGADAASSDRVKPLLDLALGLGLGVHAAAVTTQAFNALVGAGGSKQDSAVLLQIVLGGRRP
ncbi:MAG: hypothetical protein EHM59_21540 [Betaproteobacteria bacterium]|nr:MAG: hypothetical protein EHM59_21540 [Betaproteobacteria bacterium]